MKKLSMSAAAAGLLRSLLKRSGSPSDRILLTEVKSTDWHSLTFAGERHRFELRVSGHDSAAIVERICTGLSDAEFVLPGIIVADIAVAGSPVRRDDGSTEIIIDALTIEAG